MQQCIYCLTEFEEAAKEHIIHAFLGARWDDGKLICDGCQTRFANGIDTALSERLQPFRLLLGTKGDHGGTGSPIANLRATSGETLNVGPRGLPSLARPHVTVAEVGDRQIVQIKIDKPKQLDWALHEVRQLIPDAQLDRENIAPLSVQARERVDGEVKFSLNLGGLDFFRGGLKSCANHFAAHDATARAAFLGPAFDSVRAFVLDGTGKLDDFARWMTMIEPLKLPTLGPADQTIMLITRGQSVEGVMRFFGHLPFAVRLTESYTGPLIHCVYRVDPYREATPAEDRMSGNDLAKYDEVIPVFAEQSPSNNPAVQAA